MAEEKKCPHTNSTELEVGPSHGHRDGDPDWTKWKCNDCGEVYHSS